MKTSIFLNDILTKGAILGGVMLASNIAENAMFYYGGTLSWLGVYGIEWLIAIVLYCYLLYRFTRNYANLVVEERKDLPYFTYGNGLSYAVLVSMLAGVVVSIGAYMFQHYVIGYENFINHYIEFIQTAVAQSGVQMADMQTALGEVINQLKNTPEPSIISALISGVWSYLIAGTFVGLIVAAFTKRNVQLFDNDEEYEE